MSVDSLQKKGLLPNKFKYVGFFVSGLCILYALIYHFVGTDLLFDGLHTPNMIFAAGLIITISSKEISKDERIRQIRSYAHYVLFGIFIGYIFWEELDGTAESMITALSAFLTVYVLIFHFMYYFNAEWIVKNQGKSWFIVLVVLLLFLISYDILWLA